MLLLLLLAQLWAGSLAQKPQKVQMVELVEVQEGLCGVVVCSFRTTKDSQNNSTIHQYWYRRNQSDPKNQGDILVATSDPGAQNQIRVNSSLRLLGYPTIHNCTLGITKPRRQESGIYYLLLNNKDKIGPKTPLLALYVTALMQTPSIHMDNPLQSGRPNYLRCSLPGACREGSLTFSWHGEALRPLGLVPNSSEIQLNPQAQDHGTHLTCRVTVQGANVSTEKTVMLNISYVPQNLNLSIFRGDCSERRELDHNSTVEVQEGESLCLVCNALGNPPPKLNWVQGGRPWPSAQHFGAGVLKLYPVERHHEGEFICQAEHPGGSLQASLHLSVGKPPQLLGPHCSWEAPALRCGCSTQGLPVPALHWWLGSELLPGNCSNASIQLSPSPGEPWANSSLSLLGEFDASLTLSCGASNVYGAQRSSILLLPGQPRLQGAVLGAAGGAGVAGMLILCPCLLFFFVKVCKKRAHVKRGANQGDAPAPLVSAPRDFLLQSLQDSTPAVGDTPGPGEEPELYYAMLNFQGLGPRPASTQDGSSTTEYSEIKTQHKHSENRTKTQP